MAARRSQRGSLLTGPRRHRSRVRRRGRGPTPDEPESSATVPLRVRRRSERSGDGHRRKSLPVPRPWSWLPQGVGRRIRQRLDAAFSNGCCFLRRSRSVTSLVVERQCRAENEADVRTVRDWSGRQPGSRSTSDSRRKVRRPRTTAPRRLAPASRRNGAFDFCRDQPSQLETSMANTGPCRQHVPGPRRTLMPNPQPCTGTASGRHPFCCLSSLACGNVHAHL